MNKDFQRELTLDQLDVDPVNIRFVWEKKETEDDRLYVDYA